MCKLGACTVSPADAQLALYVQLYPWLLRFRCRAPLSISWIFLTYYMPWSLFSIDLPWRWLSSTPLFVISCRMELCKPMMRKHVVFSSTRLWRCYFVPALLENDIVGPNKRLGENNHFPFLNNNYTCHFLVKCYFYLLNT